MRSLLKHPWSLLVVIAFGISANMVLNDRGTVNRAYTLFHYDQAGYTAYLPAILIYKDLSFEFFDENGYRSKEFLAKGQPVPVNKYSVGPSILLYPFFKIGHWRAGRDAKHPQNGFSKPYKHSMLMGSIFYACMGLLFLRGMLLRYFSDTVSALTLLIIGIGTNLLYYSSLEGFMSHVYSFFLFGACLYTWLRFLDEEQFWCLLLCGLSAGLILATRIPNGLFFLVLLGWGIQDKASLVARGQLLWCHKWIVGAAILLGLAVLFPQFYYWKAQTGNWWVDVYQGENLFFEQPLFGKVLFSYRSGWLLYTPLMTSYPLPDYFY